MGNAVLKLLNSIKAAARWRVPGRKEILPGDEQARDWPSPGRLGRRELAAVE